MQKHECGSIALITIVDVYAGNLNLARTVAVLRLDLGEADRRRTASRSEELCACCEGNGYDAQRENPENPLLHWLPPFLKDASPPAPNTSSCLRAISSSSP